MKKKLIKTTFLMLIPSCIAKALSFFVRIYLARRMSSEAMNYYSLAAPTMLLVITLAQMGIPSAMAKLLSSEKNARKTVKASLVFSFINNALLLITVALAIPFLARVFFHDEILIPVLFSCLPMIPLITFSGLCKGILMGKQQLIPYSWAQISEEVFRLVFLLITLPLCTHPIILAKLALLSQAVGELGSAIHMLIAILVKNRPSWKFLSSQPEKDIYYALLKIAVPMTLSRLIGSFSFFLEPMVMLFNVPAQAQAAMIAQFSQLNAYVQPIITLPSFATVLISNWALPAFSEAFSQKKKERMKAIFSSTCTFSFLISASWAVFLFLFPEAICSLLYKQTVMASMLKMLAIPFAIYGLQPVLSVLIHGASQSNWALFDTTLGCVIRLAILTFAPPLLGPAAIPCALALSMLVTTLLHLFHVIRILFFQHE